MSGMSRSEVAEFQGFYGPFTVTEKLLQKIWLRGDFNASAARTTEGEPVEVSFPGKWNLLDGPDFREARLKIGGRELRGAVEIHFHAADWNRHRHHLNPAYDDVVLHVLLFRPVPGEAPAKTASGRELPAMALLDLLHHDLEEYAAEEAIAVTLERDHWQATEELVALPLEERRGLLGRHARARWEQKMRFARLRVEKLGWTEACHQAALEILGYRRNRGAMLNVATRYPLRGWAAAMPAEDVLMRGCRWTVQGARPANHPRQRLRQYIQMVAACPDWPEKMREALAGAGGADEIRAEEGVLNGDDFAAGRFRAGRKLKRLREEWGRAVTGGFVGGTRLDTLFCDGFLPLAASAGHAGLFPYWFHWYAGDFPERVVQTLRTADITDGRRFATCNGFCQGVLSLSLEKQNDPLA